MGKALAIVLIAVIVTVDNALLTGLLLPSIDAKTKRAMVVGVGILLGLSQIFLATSVDHMLNNLWFRLTAIGLLGWMCVRTLGMQAQRQHVRWWLVIRLWIYATMGNIDNFFWLGSSLRGERLWLAISSLAFIPLFVLVAVFLSEQCQKQKWILPLGAGMMAWASASLMLDIPRIKAFVESLDDAPKTTFQALITIAVVVIGLGARRWIHSKPIGS